MSPVKMLFLGWRALRPPRVVFVLGFASLINSLTSGKKCERREGMGGNYPPLPRRQ